MAYFIENVVCIKAHKNSIFANKTVLRYGDSLPRLGGDKGSPPELIIQTSRAAFP